jgi:hypothetical protein
MLKKIKKKFLISAIVTITIVITVIVGAINIFNIYSIIDNIDTTLANTIGESAKTQSKLEKIPGYTLFFPAGSNYIFCKRYPEHGRSGNTDHNPGRFYQAIGTRLFGFLLFR